MQEILQSFAELKSSTVVLLVLLVFFGLAAFLPQLRGKWTVKMLVRGALCIALSFVLSYLKIFRMPQGGSVTVASMLPMMVFAYIYGVGPGLVAGAAYGLLQLVQDFWATHPLGLIMDYPLAFAMLGLAGLLRGKKLLIPGIIIAIFGRFVAHFVSGFIFFAEYAPEGVNPIWHSLGYNGSFLLVEAIICVAIVAIPQVRSAIDRLSKE